MVQITKMFNYVIKDRLSDSYNNGFTGFLIIRMETFIKESPWNISDETVDFHNTVNTLHYGISVNKPIPGSDMLLLANPNDEILS